jgi:uncharacterized membrane protein
MVCCNGDLHTGVVAVELHFLRKGIAGAYYYVEEDTEQQFMPV